jgi:hypothetical protein
MLSGGHELFNFHNFFANQLLLGKCVNYSISFKGAKQIMFVPAKDQLWQQQRYIKA